MFSYYFYYYIRVQVRTHVLNDILIVLFLLMDGIKNKKIN